MKKYTTSFRGWLLKQVYRDDPIGDLAAELKRDVEFRSRTLNAIRNRIISLGGADEVLNVLEAASAEYSAAQGILK